MEGASASGGAVPSHGGSGAGYHQIRGRGELSAAQCGGGGGISHTAP